jgi:hypothetical protein
MNDIKNKANTSNKEDIKSHIVTVYGKFDVTNEVFVSGQGQYGKSNIKKKRATGDLANNIASAKTNATSMAAKLEVGSTENNNTKSQIKVRKATKNYKY